MCLPKVYVMLDVRVTITSKDVQHNAFANKVCSDYNARVTHLFHA